MPKPQIVARNDDDTLKDVDWVAQKLGVTAAWVYAHSSGKRRPYMKCRKVGRYRRWHVRDVDEFIEQVLVDHAA
jgi:predicted DNA-binding transcriptional regulator AlpA